MYFTRVLPYKIAHLRHVVLDRLLFDFRCSFAPFLKKCVKRPRSPEATEVPQCMLYSVCSVYFFFIVISVAVLPSSFKCEKNKHVHLAFFKRFVVSCGRGNIAFIFKEINHFVYAGPLEINPRFPFIVKKGFWACPFYTVKLE